MIKKPNRASRFTVDSIDDVDLRNLRKGIEIHNDCQLAFTADPKYLRVVVMPRGGKRNRGSATTLVKGAKSFDVYVYRYYGPWYTRPSTRVPR
jgi:hypothetical protein